MQEEVTQKTIALSMKTGKLTAQALQAALKKYVMLTSGLIAVITYHSLTILFKACNEFLLALFGN